MKKPTLQRHTLLALLLLLATTLAARASGQEARATDCVVLLHGLGRTALSMKALEWALEDRGYHVANVTYPSLLHPIAELAEEAVSSGIAACREQDTGRISFVTHSLGGILVRQYLSRRDIAGLFRVVMLGPPNQGSQMADYADSLSMLQAVAPPAVNELTTGEGSLPRSLGPVSFELGVIAGTVNRRPPLPGIPDEASDGTVSVAETRVPGMADLIELPASHSFMMWNRDVIDQALYFLEHGVFDHPREQPPAT